MKQYSKRSTVMQFCSTVVHAYQWCLLQHFLLAQKHWFGVEHSNSCGDVVCRDAAENEWTGRNCAHVIRCFQNDLDRTYVAHTCDIVN